MTNIAPIISFHKDSVVVKQLDNYYPAAIPLSNNLVLGGGVSAAEFYISSLSVFKSFVPIGLLRNFKYTNFQFHLYHWTSHQIYIFNQLTDAQEVVDWVTGEKISIDPSFSLHPVYVPQMC